MSTTPTETLHVPPAEEEGHDGTELLAHETRDEIARLVTHPVEEMKRLERVAADGESASTPLLLVLGISALLACIAAAVIALTMLVYYRV